MATDDTGYRTRDLEVGHVVNRHDDDWAVTELVDTVTGNTAVYLRNADGVEDVVYMPPDARVWDVVGQPDEDLFND